MKISRRNKNARLSFIKKRGSKSRIKRTKKRNHKQNGGDGGPDDRVRTDDLIKLKSIDLTKYTEKDYPTPKEFQRREYYLYDLYLAERYDGRFSNRGGQFKGENGLIYKVTKPFSDVDVYRQDGTRIQRLQEAVHNEYGGVLGKSDEVYMNKYDLQRLPDNVETGIYHNKMRVGPSSMYEAVPSQ